MASNDPFGFNPDDLDRFFPGAGDQLRGALGQFAKMLNASGQGGGRPGAFDELGRARRPEPAPETTGETGEGVWMIYTVDADGGACEPAGAGRSPCGERHPDRIDRRDDAGGRDGGDQGVQQVADLCRPRRTKGRPG